MAAVLRISGTRERYEFNFFFFKSLISTSINCNIDIGDDVDDDGDNDGDGRIYVIVSI